MTTSESRRNQALIVNLIDVMRAANSWAGETHIQKSVFAAQILFSLPTEYEFVLYKHGPYSFELHDVLTEMKAARYLSVEARDPYGPSFKVEAQGGELVSRFPKSLAQHRSNLKFIADHLSNRTVDELERVSTALFVTNEEPPDGDDSEIALARRLSELKPHIKAEAALKAVKSANKLIADARRSD